MEYRERILKEKSQINESFESSSLSSFSNKAVIGRSLKRACDALPKNPQQRSEIVQSLSEKFDLRINLSTKKPGRTGNELCTDEIDWLSEFMERPDITYTNPGRRDQKYIGKENGKSKFVPIRYLLWTLCDLLDMINGCPLVAQEKFDGFVDKFSEHVNKIVSGITSIYFPESELLMEPEDIEDAPKISETLSIHKLTRGFNEDDVCFIKFFKLPNEVKPFHTQFYRKEGDPEVCGHEHLPLVFDVDQTCAFCKGQYEDKVEWLQCPLCEQWFHQTCFEK